MLTEDIAIFSWGGEGAKKPYFRDGLLELLIITVLMGDSGESYQQFLKEGRCSHYCYKGNRMNYWKNNIERFLGLVQSD